MSEEIAQRLKALVVLPEELGLIPRTYMMAYNQLQLHFQGIWPPQVPGTHKDTSRQKHPCTQNNKININKKDLFKHKETHREKLKWSSY